jgi:hypothetical protein
MGAKDNYQDGANCAQAPPHFAFSFNGQQLGCGHGTFAKGG